MSILIYVSSLTVAAAMGLLALYCFYKAFKP